MADKKITLADFLLPPEIEKAVALYKEAAPGTFGQRCAAEIIEPVMPRINAALGQENNARYLAYVVEYVLGQADQRGWLDKMGPSNEN